MQFSAITSTSIAGANEPAWMADGTYYSGEWKSGKAFGAGLEQNQGRIYLDRHTNLCTVHLGISFGIRL